MPHQQLTISTPDGDVPSHVFRPADGGPWPGLLMFMDGGGPRDSLYRLAGRVADEGYVVLMPDLFYRHGSYGPWDFALLRQPGTDPDAIMAPVRAMVAALDKAATVRDVACYLDFLDQDPTVRGPTYGCFGYCMGGGLALLTAATYPDRFAAAASFHGGRLATDAPDSPHRSIPLIRARVHLGIAEIDLTHPPEATAILAQAFTAAGIEHRLELHPGASHGFCVDDFPAHDAAAAALAHQRLIELVRATIG